MTLKRTVPVFLLALLSSCSYMEYSAKQAKYYLLDNFVPGKANQKHLIERDQYAVIGKTEDDAYAHKNINICIAAYSDKYTPHELVDCMNLSRAGTHFGLNLPEGTFTILALADINTNGFYEHSEVVSKSKIKLSEKTVPSKVLSDVQLHLSAPININWPLKIPVPQSTATEESIFYPAGSIRTLDDALFDPSMATIGLYDPASFLELFPTSFCALEEDQGHKIPVIFVHGIEGTPRSFKPFIDRMDRDRYKPLFFYYPSGGDLDQYAGIFYQIFLSGNVLQCEDMPVIIVAHSMGGLVIREALNNYTGNQRENRVELFISLATPFGGHPSAALGAKYSPMVLPAWKDVNPDGEFIQQLYREPLNEDIDHILLYAYNNPASVKITANSDGVIPLSSQLHPDAQQQASKQFGFNSSHTEILNNEAVIEYIYDEAARVENIYPEEHLNYLSQGGNKDFAHIDEYNPIAQFLIQERHYYLLAIEEGKLSPALPEHEHFFRAVQGQATPETELEKDAVRYLKQFHQTNAPAL